MRGVYRKQSFSEAEKETGQYIYLEEEGVMVPTLNQCYTSILKESSHIEKSLELLAAVNTDAELAEALREPLAPTEGGKMTRNFYEVCNGLFLQERDCEQAVEERLEQDENGQMMDGQKIWTEYKELIQNVTMPYAQKRVRLSEVRSQMNYFVYQIKQNPDLNYNDKIGELICIDNGEKYFIDGKLDRKKLQGEVGDFVDFI